MERSCFWNSDLGNVRQAKDKILLQRRDYLPLCHAVAGGKETSMLYSDNQNMLQKKLQSCTLTRVSRVAVMIFL